MCGIRLGNSVTGWGQSAPDMSERFERALVRKAADGNLSQDDYDSLKAISDGSNDPDDAEVLETLGSGDVNQIIADFNGDGDIDETETKAVAISFNIAAPSTSGGGQTQPATPVFSSPQQTPDQIRAAAAQRTPVPDDSDEEVVPEEGGGRSTGEPQDVSMGDLLDGAQLDLVTRTSADGSNARGVRGSWASTDGGVVGTVQVLSTGEREASVSLRGRRRRDETAAVAQSPQPPTTQPPATPPTTQPPTTPPPKPPSSGPK